MKFLSNVVRILLIGLYFGLMLLSTYLALAYKFIFIFITVGLALVSPYFFTIVERLTNSIAKCSKKVVESPSCYNCIYCNTCSKKQLQLASSGKWHVGENCVIYKRRK